MDEMDADVKVLGKLLKYQLINSEMAQMALKNMIPLPQLPQCLAGLFPICVDNLSNVVLFWNWYYRFIASQENKSQSHSGLKDFHRRAQRRNTKRSR